MRLCACGCGKKLDGAPQQRRRPECRRKAHLNRQKRHRENRKNYPVHKEAERQRAASRYNANPEREKARMRERAKRIHTADRLAAIKTYGGACVCCGEACPQFLTLQHPDKDGHIHRKELLGKNHRNSPGAFFRKLRQSGFPRKYRIEVACWNCHMAHDLYGSCPHTHENGE
jgi:hypothetical protein